ncbi:Major Facilitator Superfamily protein [Streptomyces sp. TLI_053]|uniref:MFS transporter n=1 Tax=Streptomyces sp. TLI_053 TaxID=1855352 RepID=UPI0008798D27|nr:MFS transporter [Streptomyces sp. TLI_053]SDT06111.1 Major Facilitator Superfamily protein [Streptomyces sp. TLI_053]
MSLIQSPKRQPDAPSPVPEPSPPTAPVPHGEHPVERPAKRPVERPVERPRSGPAALLGLLTAAGGPRYAAALVVDALGTGLLRPFLLLYGIGVLALDAGSAGLAMSAGMVAGLLVLPLTGRWIDLGARSLPAAATLLVRAAGSVTLLLADGLPGFTAAAVLLGVGSQSWPATHAAVVSTLTEGRTRDAALAAGRTLRNAGLGAGALLATLAVAGGTGTLKLLAGVTAAACLLAAGLVHSLRVSAPRSAATTPAVPAPSPSPVSPVSPVSAVSAADAALRRITLLSVANLPFAFTFDVLEVALPALLVLHLHASAAWSSGIFVGNTVLVIALQLAVVLRFRERSRHTVLAAGGIALTLSYLGFWAAGGLGGTAAAGAVAAVSVLYTFGEILYSGAGTALVAATAPPHLLGRALARWELSMGVGRALAPAALTALLAVGPGALWPVLAAATLLSSVAVIRLRPRG